MQRPRILMVHEAPDNLTMLVADEIEERLRQAGNDVASFLVQDAPSAGEFDAVVVGGSAHDLKHRSAIRRYVESNLFALGTRPSAMFETRGESPLPSLLHAPRHRWRGDDDGETVAAATGWRPTAHVVVGSNDHATDWRAVDEFADEFSGAVGRALALEASEKEE